MTTDTGAYDPDSQPYHHAFSHQQDQPGQELARLTQADIESILKPYTVDMRTWLIGINSVDEFPETDPDAVAASMMAQILTAPTPEAALGALNLEKGGPRSSRSAASAR
jgi:hypothetical protein